MTSPRLTYARLLALAQAARRWGQAERTRRRAVLARLENTQSTRRGLLADAEAEADRETEDAATALLAALEPLWPEDGGA